VNAIEKAFLHSTPISLIPHSYTFSERSAIVMAPSFDNLTEDNGSDSEEDFDVAGSCFNSLAALYLTALE